MKILMKEIAWETLSNRFANTQQYITENVSIVINEQTVLATGIVYSTFQFVWRPDLSTKAERHRAIVVLIEKLLKDKSVNRFDVEVNHHYDTFLNMRTIWDAKVKVERLR